MQEYSNRYYKWYEKNFRKIVLLFLITVIFTLLLVYFPFANLVLTSSVGFLISAISWYLLFLPSNRVLVYMSCSAILLAAILTIVDLALYAESLGIFLFLMITFLFANLMREKGRNK